MSDQFDHDSGIVVENAKPKLKKPSMYQVVLINDDFTPMEFVVHVLQYFFSHDHETAHTIMLNVHTSGKGVCGVYTKDIAETKCMQVNEFSKENEQPLMCEVELVD